MAAAPPCLVHKIGVSTSMKPRDSKNRRITDTTRERATKRPVPPPPTPAHSRLLLSAGEMMGVEVDVAAEGAEDGLGADGGAVDETEAEAEAVAEA